MHDPIERLELSHGHLSELVLRVGRLLRDSAGRPLAPTADQRTQIFVLLETLRDELLQHFADEEEALFPFVRGAVPSRSAAVDALETSHDAICGSVVRLAHLAGHGAAWQPLPLYERFERAYAEHSRDEANLLEDLAATLDDKSRKELTEHLRGISSR